MYNQDVFPTREYSAQVGPLTWVFGEERYLTAFTDADRVSGRAKRYYETLGVLSVCLAVVGLSGEGFSLLAESLGSGFPTAINACIGGSAVVSIALILVARRTGLKQRWCLSVLEREQLRRWRFQLLYDGAFVDACYMSEAAGRAIYDERWRVLEQRSR